MNTWNDLTYGKREYDKSDIQIISKLINFLNSDKSNEDLVDFMYHWQSHTGGNWTREEVEDLLNSQEFIKKYRESKIKKIIK